MAPSAPRPHHGAVVDWDAAGLPADVSTVEELARLQLAASRRGYRLRLRNTPTELVELITWLGLQDVLLS
jgi:hypothetical protein